MEAKSMNLAYRVKRGLRPLVKGPVRPIVEWLRKVASTYIRHDHISRDHISHEQLVALLNRPDPTILEIGCNDGTDTLAFLRAAPKATIYCFEPDPRAIKRFRQRIDSSSVTLFELA